MHFLLALLALTPLTLAAPAPASAAPIQSQECACVNASGTTRASGTCQIVGGALSGGSEEWCARATSYAPEMPTVFNTQRCAEAWGADWAGAKCRAVQLCVGPLDGYFTRC